MPTGSVEQHGAHLPAGTDSFAAGMVAAAVAERMDGLVLPGPLVGVTPMHMPYEATVTLTPDTFIRVITEICEVGGQARCEDADDRQLARGEHSLARHRRGGSASPRRPDYPHRAGMLRG